MTWCIGEAALWAMGMVVAAALLLALAVAAGRLWLAARTLRALDDAHLNVLLAENRRRSNRLGDTLAAMRRRWA